MDTACCALAFFDPRHVVSDAPSTPQRTKLANVLNPNDFLHEIRRRGGMRIRRVSFRNNRSTIWSLTQRGTVLNVHEAFRAASADLLDDFAILAREGGIGSGAARRASDRLAAWPGLAEAMASARAEHATRVGSGETPHCCATPDQRRYLRALYRYFNATRFGNELPDDIPIRLSARMRSALGHMVPGGDGDARSVTEIALNVDLMLAGNGAQRVDTLLHEMAHAADYLESGAYDHGKSWRAWARKAGCRPTRLYDRHVRQRSRRSDVVTRVPSLPPALATLS